MKVSGESKHVGYFDEQMERKEGITRFKIRRKIVLLQWRSVRYRDGTPDRGPCTADCSPRTIHRGPSTADLPRRTFPTSPSSIAASFGLTPSATGVSSFISTGAKGSSYSSVHPLTSLPAPNSTHPIMAEDLNAIKAQIQRHLVDSGNYDVISKHLKLKLYESGWLDQVTQLATKELESQPKDSAVNFDKLYSELRPKAEELVPASVKEDTVEKLREYLDDVIQ
ncbi:hypothetical protein JCM33374_g2257 [Metschnikowia sp. JCM 33374]|nr:hypothetical protein JCM33374_g2257 [Metschnikowia sp. JCM 33374]